MPDSLTLLNEALGDATLDLQGTGFDTVDEIIDMNMQFSLLNYITIDVSVVHELDGLYDVLITVPLLASEMPGGILYVLMTSGFFHRVRVKADGFYRDAETTTELHGQQYHIRFVEATMVYQGQLS